MCEYCENKKIISCIINCKKSYVVYSLLINKDVKKDYIIGYDIKPNYCPIYGKKLGE